MNFNQTNNNRDMSATSALPTSPPPSAGLPFGFTASGAATSSSNYRALSFACAPAIQLKKSSPLPQQKQQQTRSLTNEQFVSNTTKKLQRNDSWQVPFSTRVSHSCVTNTEPTLSLPLVPEELEDYGLRFGMFAVTGHSNASLVLKSVNEALAKQPHLRVVPDKHTPGTVYCVTYPHGVAIRFVVRVFRLTEEDQESNELQGIRGGNLVVVEEVQSNDCMCSQRPLISQLFFDEIRSGEFLVPFAIENVPEGGCLIGRPCEQNVMDRDIMPTRGGVEHSDNECSRLLQLAARPQYVDVQEQTLCIIARQSSSDPSFARALARVDGLNVLLEIYARKPTPDSAVCAMTAIANVAEAVSDTNECSEVSSAVKAISELVNGLGNEAMNSPAYEQVLQQARCALGALKAYG